MYVPILQFVLWLSQVDAPAGAKDTVWMALISSATILINNWIKALRAAKTQEKTKRETVEALREVLKKEVENAVSGMRQSMENKVEEVVNGKLNKLDRKSAQQATELRVIHEVLSEIRVEQQRHQRKIDYLEENLAEE